jgi:hypothetical protein
MKDGLSEWDEPTWKAKGVVATEQMRFPRPGSAGGILFGLVLIRGQMPKALNSVEYSVINAAKCG